ncbi:hypothetical protein QJ133_20010 [Priestia megaterium]|nr:hypothetical protein [Priestia megaterium]MDI3093414.1 hypothetical protein [Priestia megaterium]
MKDKESIYDTYFEKQKELNDEKLQIWLDYILFSWRWSFFICKNKEILKK